MIHLINQIIRFGMVGFLCFFIDYGCLLVLTEFVGIDYLISSGISFTVSVIVNYLLSMRFVFKAKKDNNKIKELIIFVFMSIIGLGINQLVMWCSVEKLGVMYQISKINFLEMKLYTITTAVALILDI